MDYSSQQQYTEYQPPYVTQDINTALPFLNQNGNPASINNNHAMPSGDVHQQLKYRASNASLGAPQGQVQLNPSQYVYQVAPQSRPQSTYSVGHDASNYAPSSPGGTSFVTMSERRMSRDSIMEGVDDARPLAHHDFYRASDDAGSHLSHSNMSLRRIPIGSQNPMDPLRRPHIAPPIFTQQSNQSSTSFDRRSGSYSRTYPYPHPNAPEPTAGFPYAFPDPDMGDVAPSPGSSLQKQQLHTIMSEETPYSRSPELRVSHKLAERKRRREMKDLFDDLRDKLPLDRTLKTSKWEILSKAVEHVQFLDDQIASLKRENEDLRRGGAGGSMTPSASKYHQP